MKFGTVEKNHEWVFHKFERINDLDMSPEDWTASVHPLRENKLDGIMMKYSQLWIQRVEKTWFTLTVEEIFILNLNEKTASGTKRLTFLVFLFHNPPVGRGRGSIIFKQFELLHLKLLPRSAAAKYGLRNFGLWKSTGILRVFYSYVFSTFVNYVENQQVDGFSNLRNDEEVTPPTSTNL